MCHLVLFLPILGLGLFFFLPWEEALFYYVFIIIISTFLYWKIVKAMQLKVKTGREGMVGLEGLVIKEINPEGKVRINQEIWNAFSEEKIPKGERVKIIGWEGIKLKVNLVDLRSLKG